MPVRPSALLLCVALVAASSYPDATSCNVEDSSLGSPTGNMKWVRPAVRTDAYTLRTGDSCATDPSSYVPGQFMSLHLRTHKYKGNFRGMLLYATDAGGNKVGDWQLDWPNSNMFWKPPTSPCQNKSLMHLNGAEKYYHHEFKFVTPPKGTGLITFHCLIKRGQANTGEFYWPNLAGPLMLAEQLDVPATGNVWVEAQPGQSCTTACGTAGCAANLLTQANKWSEALQRDVRLTVGCNVPGLASDLAVGISKDSSGWCTYPSPAAKGMSCDAVPTSGVAICPCGSAALPSFGVNVPLPDTACLNNYVVMGAASKTSSTTLSFFLMLLSGLFLNQHKPTNILMILSCVFYCAYTVEAHNWMYTVSRSFNQASTYKPCRPKVNDVPHWQINQGQEFTAEWATGHDHFFYYTVINADDILLMEDIQQQDLDDYINTGCPASDGQHDWLRGHVVLNPVGPNQPVKHWYKQHMNHNADKTAFVAPDTLSTIFDHNISSTDPDYIPRHPKFGSDPNEVRWIYLPQYVNKDVRCSYYNPTYPHIIAVHRFVQVETVMSRAGDRDTAAFTIELSPGHKGYAEGSGAFIIQYLWQGYFDCIDVELFPASVPVTAVGGRPLLSTEPQWNKVDHCQFEEIQSIEANCAEVVTSADRCLLDCIDNDNCNGVNVVPMWLPSTVFPFFSNRVGIPWDNMGRCSQARFADLDRSAKVCYGLQPRLPNNTHASYSVTDDPEDPLFYATCFIKRSPYTFDLSLASKLNITIVQVPPSWSFSDQCVSCIDWKSAQTTDTIPTWTLPKHCENCVTANIPAVPALPGSVVASGLKCDGSYSGATRWYYHKPPPQCGTKRCIKTLFIVGSNTIRADECIAKAKADPECSEWVQHQDNKNNGCECWVKDDVCCGKCVPADYDFRNWEWTIYTTKDQVDVGCVNGVKSSDNKYCCPKTCVDPNGTPVCMPAPGLQVSFQDGAIKAPPGWAVDTGAKFAVQTGQDYPSSLTNQWGWNCDLTVAQTKGDREPLDGTNYHSTYVIPDSSICGLGSVDPTWSVTVPIGNYQVDTLYTRPFASIRGCEIQGSANYDSSHAQLNNYDMAWVSRHVNTTDGKLSFSGGQSCGGIAAMLIYDEKSLQSQTYCQNLPDMCCTLFIDMEKRPCASFEPPCKL